MGNLAIKESILGYGVSSSDYLLVSGERDRLERVRDRFMDKFDEVSNLVGSKEECVDVYNRYLLGRLVKAFRGGVREVIEEELARFVVGGYRGGVSDFLVSPRDIIDKLVELVYVDVSVDLFLWLGKVGKHRELAKQVIMGRLGSWDLVKLRDLRNLGINFIKLLIMALGDRDTGRVRLGRLRVLVRDLFCDEVVKVIGDRRDWASVVEGVADYLYGVYGRDLGLGVVSGVRELWKLFRRFGVRYVSVSSYSIEQAKKDFIRELSDEFIKLFGVSKKLSVDNFYEDWGEGGVNVVSKNLKFLRKALGVVFVRRFRKLVGYLDYGVIRVLRKLGDILEVELSLLEERYLMIHRKLMRRHLSIL